MRELECIFLDEQTEGDNHPTNQPTNQTTNQQTEVPNMDFRSQYFTPKIK